MIDRIGSYVIGVCCLVLALDVSSVPAFSEWWFRAGYLLAGIGVVAWQRFRSPWALSLFYGAMVVASSVRALLLTLEGDRWSGAALNLILAVVIRHNVDQRRERHG